MPTPLQYDAIILGAGGAGLMCAAIAGQRGRRVLVVDHADQPGKKILISGGGRCNFTNTGTSADCFISANPHFAKSALSRYTAQDFIDLVESHQIAWHEKTLGQLFCDDSARQIVDLLLAECEKGGVGFSFGKAVTGVSKAESGFEITLGGDNLPTTALVVATGGPSIPKLGATGFAYDIARQFGLKVVEPRPALVPLTLGSDETLFKELSGVSAQTIVKYKKTEFREASLFTHKGLSGPAMLQISSYWKNGEAIGVDFLPDRTGDWLLASKRNKPRATLRAILGSVLPDRLAEIFTNEFNGVGVIGEMADSQLQKAEAVLHDWQFHPNGTEGYAKAEVTVGGVSTEGLSSRTMEAKRVSGLYVIGEAVDVTGWLGGYNFQWAWSSGWAAGQAL